MFTSLFWTIVSGSQIFSFLFNSFFLANFEPKLLFIVDAVISLISMIWIGFLPEPFIPPEKAIGNKLKTPKESLQELIKLITSDSRTLKMYGIFFNSATANAIANGFLVPFYCLML